MNNMRSTVLIVEDSDLQLRIYEAIFRNMGVRTIRAGTRREALALARQQVPNLVIMDLNLPDGTGIEATRELRQLEGLADVPIVAVTTRLGTTEESTLREAGFTDFLAKPIDITSFTAMVNKHLTPAA